MMPDRISIWPYVIDDVPRLFEAVIESKAQLSEWLPWCHPDYSIDDSRSWVESQIVAFKEGTEYAFLIVNGNNRLLGGCGLNYIDRPNLRANLGYWVRSSDARKGIATEAVRLLTAWVFSQKEFRRLEILACEGNQASQRVAERSGATSEGVLRNRINLRGRLHDAVIYSIVR